MSRLKHAFWAVPSLIAFHDLVATVIRVKGPSMQPTLNPADTEWDDWVLVDKFSVRVLRRFQPGSVVVLRAPDDPHHRLVKRLTAVEGDTLLLMSEGSKQQHLAKGRCWILGDNPAQSGDSASAYGPVHLALLEGRAAAVVWPPWRLRLLPPQPPPADVVLLQESADGRDHAI